MNEFSILMNLLSNRISKNQIGATKQELMEALNLRKDKDAYYFQELLSQLSNYIEPLGLYVRFNPVDHHWFISHDFKTSNLLSANPFQDKPKLAATLFCVLVACLKSSGSAKVKDIKELRKKKGVLRDLKKLEEEGYILLDDEEKQVILTPLIGYQLDIQKLFVKLSLKLKEEKE
ncbi:MAG: hypothetical protein BAJALOKI3v1_70042 [Promethearchaeota archaeon]|jgi:hypothetical protein|nr:MAG: hypothetical protein BAJALOKI3v1_70042 [Candidatus Lokiarchaeota archaeon]